MARCLMQDLPLWLHDAVAPTMIKTCLQSDALPPIVGKKPELFFYAVRRW
jgi:hypothetical protein